MTVPIGPTKGNPPISILFGIRKRAFLVTALFLAAATLLLGLEKLPAQTPNIIHVVNGEVDVLANGKCSLIEAIQNANDAVTGSLHPDCTSGSPIGEDIVALPQNGLYVLTKSLPNEVETGLPAITSKLVIQGNKSVIKREEDDPDVFRFFKVNSSGDLRLDDLTLTGGASSGVGGGAIFVDSGKLDLTNSTISKSISLQESGDTGGGAVANIAGVVNLNHVTLINNSSRNLGGAIYSEGGWLDISYSSVIKNESRYSGGGMHTRGGQLTIVESVISENYAGSAGYGGGIDTNDILVTIIESTLQNNIAATGGGGAHFKGPAVTIKSSTFKGNSAVGGGGLILATGSMILVNSTISGNTAGDQGAGLFKYGGSAEIVNSTIVGNTLTWANGKGGGIYNFKDSLTLSHTLISGNNAANGPEVYVQGGSIFTGNYNLFGLDNKSGIVGFIPGVSDVVPQLGVVLSKILTPINNNGGPTETHALVLGSPAIDKIPNVNCNIAPVMGLDQRGEPRSVDGDGQNTTSECDIGAFEFKPLVPFPTPTATTTLTPPPTLEASWTPIATLPSTATSTKASTPTATLSPTTTPTKANTPSATSTTNPSVTATLLPTYPANFFPMILYGFTPTPTYTPTPPPTVAPTATSTPTATVPAIDELQNGTFEQGRNEAWSEYSSNGYDIVTNQKPTGLSAHSGVWLAWLGGAPNETSAILQTVTVPQNRPYLQYWHWIASQDVCGYDVAGVTVVDDGVVDEDDIFDATWLCSANNTNGWHKRVIDLRTYMGKSVQLMFLVGLDGTLNSSWFIDDVEFIQAPDRNSSNETNSAAVERLKAELARLTE